jgi:hypothetical protein
LNPVNQGNDRRAFFVGLEATMFPVSDSAGFGDHGRCERDAVSMQRLSRPQASDGIGHALGYAEACGVTHDRNVNSGKKYRVCVEVIHVTMTVCRWPAHDGRQSAAGKSLIAKGLLNR